MLPSAEGVFAIQKMTFLVKMMGNTEIFAASQLQHFVEANSDPLTPVL